jgi:DNA-binding CsgD family transcriptional regulator
MPERNEKISIDDLLGSIYEGPLETVPWRSFVELFYEAMDALLAALILRPPSEGDRGLLISEMGSVAQWESAYLDRYFALDPFVNLQLGEVVTLQELAPMESFVQSEFYTQLMQPMGAFYALAVDVREPSGLEARLRAARSAEAREFGEREKELCARIVPHLQRSLQIHGRLRRVESERDLYAGAVDQFAVGTILLDEQGQVLQMNQVAARLIEEGDGLTVEDGTLRAGSSEETLELKRLISQALAAQKAKNPAIIEALRVRRAPEGKQIRLVVRPVPVAEWSPGKACPAVAVFIGHPEDRTTAPVAIVQQLFDFTKAEALLARLLANGMTLDEAASELGIARNTARAHLRRIFSKTGVTRQAELVRLILRSVANLG